MRVLQEELLQMHQPELGVGGGGTGVGEVGAGGGRRVRSTTPQFSHNIHIDTVPPPLDIISLENSNVHYNEHHLKRS